MAPSRSNSFYLTVSHIQQRPLGLHWLIPVPLTQDWTPMGWIFLSDNLTYRDTVCTTGGYSATFSIQISMLNSCMEYYQNILTWNIKTFKPKYKETQTTGHRNYIDIRVCGCGLWTVDCLTEVILILLFSVLERREQWVGGAWTGAGEDWLWCN